MKKDETVLSLKNDFVFKAVYGRDTEESKYILMCLLNKILDRKDDPIKRIEIKNPFQLKRHVDDKETILDIKAETETEIYDIEMQIAWDKDMPARLVYYHGGIICDALNAGEPYGKMKKTITICITDSVAFKEYDEFYSEFFFIEKHSNILLSEKTKICCIELPKVNPQNKPVEELTPLEICLEYLRYANENDNGYVDELIRRGGKELEMAQEIFSKVTEDTILREEALAREKFRRDKISWEHKFESGIEWGELRMLVSLVQKKLAKGKSKEQIAEELEETVAVVSRIINKINEYPEYSAEDITDIMSR